MELPLNSNYRHLTEADLHIGLIYEYWDWVTNILDELGTEKDDLEWIQKIIRNNEDIINLRRQIVMYSDEFRILK